LPLGEVHYVKTFSDMNDGNIAALDGNPLGLRIGSPKGYVTNARLGIYLVIH
jgi:hypothetical protein